MSASTCGVLRRWFWMVGALTLAGLSACSMVPQEQVRQLGQRWFAGSTPLKGRMIGHEQDLPAAAAACINCHGATSQRERFALALNRAWLTQPQARRGGPPSRYDVKSFCRVLREGVDPAWVVINQTMPRYDITDFQCQALWLHLNREASPHANR
jgi:hypothetical protein